jgi:ribonuclease BN (tRNA processing enzyme)
VGYYETLDIITESYKNIEINESSIKNLHNIIMKHFHAEHIQNVKGIRILEVFELQHRQFDRQSMNGLA